MLEEFRSADGIWFQTLEAASKENVDAYFLALNVTPEIMIESTFVSSPEIGGGPRAGKIPRSGHKIYVIQRSLPGVGDAPLAEQQKISRGSQGIIEQIGNDIEWNHSYLTSEGTYCVYRATDPKLIEEHAKIADIPADPITEVEHIVHDFEFAKSSFK